MDLPQPPQDIELRNIIDKLAQFVARNGPEFEQMTKTKQKGNPKFQFLYGGEFFNYYQYKVTTEQAILKQQGILTTNPPNSWNNPPPMPPAAPVTSNGNPEIDQLTQQQEALQEQIKQSEQNLTAQHAVLLQQQQGQVEATVVKCECDDLQREAEASGVPLNELYALLQPIIDNCTKDSISTGKSWILQHAIGKMQALCIAHCLLFKVVQGTVPFSQKLHIIYLVNDVLHHCARKNANDLKDALESVVVPMFCNASMGANDEQKHKLEKLLKLWESKANYLAPDTVDRMHQPANSYQQYQAEQVSKYANEVANLAQQTKATFEGYRAQHQAFVCHAMQQIMDLQQQKQNLEQPPIAAPTTNIIPLDAIQANLQQTIQSISQTPSNTSIPPPQTQFPPQLPPTTTAPPPLQQQPQETFMPPIDPSIPPPNLAPPPNGIDIPPFNQPPPGFFPPPALFPDFSKPPPGFPPPPQIEPEDLMPTVPYYDLPAGLIVPLIKLEDTSFKPLDPKAIRLPPPAPPSERLLAAVDAFYAPPSHDRPRDSEGWEKLGLYEFYKAKNQAKKEKEEQIAMGLREKSKSPSPVAVLVEKSPSPPKRRYTSRSPTPPSSHRDRDRRSRSRTRSRSRSRSPPRRRRSRNSRRRRSSSRSRSRSRSRSPAGRSPPRRSPSPLPASFGAPPPFMRSSEQELDSTNKGHQMLKKMGWGGSGLGANEQGIDTPISGGDVRDRQDQFKGVGCNLNDPYENFRKNKGAAFITRMKARAEERAHESKVYD